MGGAIHQLPQYAFMTWCSVKAQGQLYLYLYLYLLRVVTSLTTNVENLRKINFHLSVAELCGLWCKRDISFIARKGLQLIAHCCDCVTVLNYECVEEVTGLRRACAGWGCPWTLQTRKRYGLWRHRVLIEWTCLKSRAGKWSQGYTRRSVVRKELVTIRPPSYWKVPASKLGSEIYTDSPCMQFLG
jgi:hypothetical protein